MVDFTTINMSLDNLLYRDYVIVVTDEKSDKKQIIGEVSKLFSFMKRVNFMQIEK